MKYSQTANTLRVDKQSRLEYSCTMNNLEWYSEVIRFCQLSSSCKSCPYSLLNGEVIQEDPAIRPCFSSKDSITALETWLLQGHEGDDEVSCGCEDEDNQWLKDLLKVQFQDDVDDELCMDDEFI